MRYRNQQRFLTPVLLSVVLSGAPACNDDSSSDAPRLVRVAGNLDNPRGLAFAPDGTLYVAESGRGGRGECVVGGDGNEVCFGATGAVTRIRPEGQERLVSELPSLALPASSEAGAAPEGANATGPHDVAVGADGTVFVLLGLGGNPNLRQVLEPEGANFGRLLSVKADGTVKSVADLPPYEKANNPDEGDPDEAGVESNPYAVAREGDEYLVADAAANALLRVNEDGEISTVAVFPERLVDVTIPNFPPQISMESVPTTVAVGPDGALYVGELTGFPYPVGAARVYRVTAGQAPTVFASGFTNIIDLAFDSDGNLYVLEIAKDGLLAAGTGTPQGALSRVSPDGRVTRLVTEGLASPGGVALSPQGGIYVSNFSTFPGMGEVLRVELCDTRDPRCREPRALVVP